MQDILKKALYMMISKYMKNSINYKKIKFFD